MNLTCQYDRKADSDLSREPLDFSWLAQTLDPTELELLKHYLEHTSKDPAAGDQEQYTLQVGIPNLACQSKPLMRSVLALAAVCKCCDIINQPSTPGVSDRSQVVELLSLAHQYHLQSLHEIQATLHEAKNYDHVLANAAMMGMYGSASHCARIWLEKTATFNGPDPPLSDLMMLGPPQWMSLFRAVRLAYAGILNSSPQASPGNSPGAAILQYEYSTPSRSPSESPRNNIASSHPLGPILAATVGSALARLGQKAGQIQSIAQGMGSDDDPELQACLTALAIFNKIVTETLLPAADSRGPSAPGHGRLAIPVDIDHDPMGRLSEISPWLRRYTASISSMIPSPLPRRTIMSFIHKVPTSYLNLIECMIGLIQTGPPDGTVPTTEPSLAQQLAVEIFAHWLVLVIMLDNVWWIGGIGAWELGRVVSVRKDMRWRACLWNEDVDWWPESMFEISRQFDKHRSLNPSVGCHDRGDEMIM